MGLGNFPMSFLTHQTLFSLYAYWIGGAVVIITGMVTWWLSHVIWLNHSNTTLFLLIMMLTVFSTTFYANMFVFQNYNVLGWLFFPIGLYGILNANWPIAMAAWFCASFTSTTVVFLACITGLMVAVSTHQLMPIWVLLPAVIKLGTHFWPNFIEKSSFQAAISIARSLGFFKRKARYKLNLAFSIDHLYYALLYSQFIVTIFFGTGRFPLLTGLGMMIYLVNGRFFRFADPQSIQMFILSLAVVDAIKSDTLWILPSFWLLVSPLPLLLRMPAERTLYDMVPVFKPVSVEILLDRLTAFIKPVLSGERVLMLFEDPKDEFGRIFDGYRILIQPLSYIASRMDILLLPDYWAINEMDFEGADGFWGRDPDSGVRNLRSWKADYLIIYTINGGQPDGEWLKRGFTIEGKFDWEEQADQLHGIRPFSGPTPTWWLLKPSKSFSTAEVDADSRKLYVPTI
ncbi:hypothetical protein C4565_00285 [Candidatus Parcubacteria bacterium]|nr:MAG: hypothetical protein C4565_00285 [Candidatus Parcubacteria bacterium]